ncbi:unnamed protein product [Paramecium sonneborni]|uniref:Uncharacterized protein n=1 Tax=Paramecium sonneborni TaxID=65129 RepID=A0A8S1QXS9_9CILI|nr:unnamed protein product [Paramecium sonneborni]
MELKCNQNGHQFSPVQTICCKIDCQKSRPACAQCMIENHHNHIKELKSIYVFKEWSQSKQIIYQKLKSLQNDLLEFVSEIDQLIRSVTIDSTQIMENCNLRELEEFVNKFIQLDQIERTGVINQTIPILTQAITSFKQEIKSLKGKTNSFYYNRQNFGKIQTQNSNKQVLDLSKLRMLLIITCPPDCICGHLEMRRWHCNCGQSYYLDEDGNIICLKCQTKCFIKDFKFQCEKAKQKQVHFYFRSCSQVLMALASSIESSDLQFSENNHLRFASSINMNLIKRWNE